MAVIAHVGILVLCHLLRHPPVTSIAFQGKVENAAERTTNVLAMKGTTLRVSCACGHRMVSPIWHPWWRLD